MKIALFKRIAEQSFLEYETVGDEGYEKNDKMYVRISEYIEVDFPPRAKEEVIQTQLAALDNAEQIARTKLQEVLNGIQNRRNELLAITYQPESR